MSQVIRVGEDANRKPVDNSPPIGSLALQYLATYPQQLLPPCTVCGTPHDKHGSFPTCASHPYTPDENCQHVIGARCVGAECQDGCVRAKRSETFNARVRTHGYVDRVTGERIHDPDRLSTGSAVGGVKGLDRG